MHFVCPSVPGALVTLGVSVCVCVWRKLHISHMCVTNETKNRVQSTRIFDVIFIHKLNQCLDFVHCIEYYGRWSDGYDYWLHRHTVYR